jgi:hypothetical protein
MKYLKEFKSESDDYYQEVGPVVINVENGYIDISKSNIDRIDRLFINNDKSKIIQKKHPIGNIYYKNT